MWFGINTFCDWNKGILQSRQIHIAIWTNALSISRNTRGSGSISGEQQSELMRWLAHLQKWFQNRQITLCTVNTGSPRASPTGDLGKKIKAKQGKMKQGAELPHLRWRAKKRSLTGQSSRTSELACFLFCTFPLNFLHICLNLFHLNFLYV